MVRRGPTVEDDGYYITRCLDGHPDDFRHLFRRYQPVLLAHLAGRLGSRDRAEDAAQETLVRAYFKMDTLREPLKFFSWLLGIADRVAKEQQRSYSVRSLRESVQGISERTPHLELSEGLGLEAAVAGLPEPYRQVILLRYYGYLSCAQVAQQLDAPLGTVTKTLSRAYALLRASLERGQQTHEVNP